MTENERRLKRERMKLTHPDKSIEHMGTVRFIAKCNHDAPSVLARAKEILLIANEHAFDYGQYDERWLSIFPQWFLNACEPEKPMDLRIKESEEFRNLPWDEKVRQATDDKWSALDWTSWILPEDRIWIWWDAICTDYDTIVVAVEVTDWPFPSGALDWLFRACGAVSVDAEK